MDRQEVILNYGVSEEVLHEYNNRYRKMHTSDAGNVQDADDVEYSDADIERISRMIELGDMGLSFEMAVQYLLVEDGEHAQQEKLQMLNHTRKEILEEIHKREEQLIKLDYARFQLQKEIGNS